MSIKKQTITALVTAIEVWHWYMKWNISTDLSILHSSTTEHYRPHFTLQEYFEKSSEYAKDISTCFVDLEKAHNRVPCESFGKCCGSRCWRLPVTGCQVNVFLLISLCPCRGSSITTIHRWTPTRVCAVTALFHSLHQWFSTFSLNGAESRHTWLFCWKTAVKIFNAIQLTRFVL